MEKRAASATNRIDGDVPGAAVLAGTINGDVHITVTGAPAAQAPPTPLPAGWSDLPELPAPVRFLMRAQVDAAREMPYRLPGARRPSLATVHVRQDLGSGSDEPPPEQPQPVPIVDRRGQVVEPPSPPITRLAVRPPTRTVWEALNRDDHVVVTGGPGQGKSTLSLRLAADVAERWLTRDGDPVSLAEQVVPLRLTARELAERLGRPFPEAVAESAGEEYGALLASPLEQRTVEGRIAGCRWLLLVDGLDEVADTTKRDRLVTVLAAWTADPSSPYRVVVTTRPIEGAALAPLQRIGAARYELQPFDQHALRQFARNWFRDHDRAYRFVRQVRAAHLDELARVPLLATIAAIIFDQPGHRPLPDNRYELYEAYLKYLRTAHHAEPGPFDPVRDALLEHLGHVRLEADTSLVVAAQDWAARHLPHLTGTWPEDLVAYLAAVGPLTRRGDDLRFLHHSFAEHLAATAKARLLPERFDPAHADFAGLLHAARAEDRGRHARAVLLHHSRLHPAEAGRLLEHLHSGGADRHLLAARLLARHLPTGAAAVDAFLTTVRAWAMTTQHPALKILSETSRAAHHPGTAAWLLDLMRAEDAPWPSRVEAASALATRLRGAEAPDAVRLLRRAVNDPAIPVEHRLTAAEALTECGPEGHRASQEGLRAVLASPSATAEQLRNAAVVLATFDGESRDHAVAALTAILDDPDARDHARVHAATGLIEIDIEHHERGAEVFREVLRTRTDFSAGLRDAAVGLGSLGPHHAGEAVTALTRLISDRRLPIGDRISAVEALSELGPQHRVTAVDHLVALSRAFGVTAYLRTRIARSLADMGAQQQALDLLRAVLADWTTDANGRRWAGQALADLGPEHRDEAAAALRDVVTHPSASVPTTVQAFGNLAALGEPYPVESLRAVLADRSIDPSFRVNAGFELIGLGPEFHREVTRHLTEIATRHADPEGRMTAWRALRRLGTDLRERASEAMLALVRPEQAPLWASHRDYPVFNQFDVVDPDAFAEAMTAVLHDPAWDGQARINAVRNLIALGSRRVRRRMADEVVRLVGAPETPDSELPRLAAEAGKLGSGSRAQVVAALRAVAMGPRATASTVCQVAKAMENVDHWADTAVVARLRDIVADELLPLPDRRDAALALARATPDAIESAVAVVMREGADGTFGWESRIRSLAALGADVAPALRSYLADADSRQDKRLVAASALVELRPDLREEALAEIRQQGTDEYLDHDNRIDAVTRLAEHDPTTVAAAIAFQEETLADESLPVFSRVEAATKLGPLDPALIEKALAALRRFTTSTEFTTDERTLAVTWSVHGFPSRGPEVRQAVSVLLHDPATRPIYHRWLASFLPGKSRVDAERELLLDRTASPDERVGGISEWQQSALAADAVAMLRDVMAAVETRPADRVRAAEALGALSPRSRPEAIAVLERLADDPALAYNTRRGLLRLAPLSRPGPLAEDYAVALDTGRPRDERNSAVSRILGLTGDTPDSLIPVLRDLVDDDRTSDADRVKLLYALRRSHGLQRLRDLRDDERTRPATRWAAAVRLRAHAVDDRAVGLRVLHRIATDPACRPTLRWRVAKDLFDFGGPGRDAGATCLWEIATDEAMPALVRVHAAGALGLKRPDLRTEVVEQLRRLADAEKPLVRFQVLDAVGAFDPVEGAIRLLGLARDRTPGPGVRLRAASAAAQHRRDRREAAAVVAREIAHDPEAPRHVRVKAARALARWSDLCRPEAQGLLRDLGVVAPVVGGR
ncbi:NACHT domain-containing protein [Actinosynnema sp. NPDC004786]